MGLTRKTATSVSLSKANTHFPSSKEHRIKKAPRKSFHPSLTLERNVNSVKDVRDLLKFAFALPPLGLMINSAFWVFRVRLSKNQAIVAMKVADTIRIGFEQVVEYSIFPYSLKAETLYEKLKRSLTDVVEPRLCIEAIQMVQQAIRQSLKP